MLFLSSGMAWAQTQTLESSTSVEYPEYRYRIKSGNGFWMAANTAPTQNNIASFAFFAAGDDFYKIYSIDKEQWVSYDKTSTTNSTKNFATLVDSQDGANAWKITTATRNNQTVYQIQPQNNDDSVSDRYWNWNGGVNVSGGYSYDDTRTVGIWKNNASDDGGSAWILTRECDYSITDEAGNLFKGEYLPNGEEAPSFTGFVKGNVEGQFANGKFTGTISFPFPVSKEGGVTNMTTIASAAAAKKWHATDNSVIMVQTSGYDANDSNWLWAIYPQFNNGAFTFKIKSIGKDKWIYTNAIGSKVDGTNNNDSADGAADAVALSDVNATQFDVVNSENNTVAFHYKVDNNNQYLSINSKNDTKVYLGVHTGTHVGTDCHFSQVASYVYNFVYGGTVKATQEGNVALGAEYPAIGATKLPYGVSATKPSGNVILEDVVDGKVTVNIDVTISGLPFEFADSYANINNWYYLKNKEVYYLSHDSDLGYIALGNSQKSVDANNKDAFTWAFIGNPFDGFQIVNKAAGDGYILSSSTTMVGETGAETYPVMTETSALPTGNNALWVPTASSYSANGFFLAQKDNSANKMNNRGSKLAYWTGGADLGSTFNVELRAYVELQTLIGNATALLDNLGDGTTVGYVTADSRTAISSAISVAEAAITNGSGYDGASAAIQTAIAGINTIQPETDKYYTIVSNHNDYASGKRMGFDANSNGLIWNSDDNVSNWFKFVADAEGKLYLYNVKNGKYLSTANASANNQQFAHATTTDAAKAVTITNMGKGNIVKIVPDDGAMLHAQAGSDVAGNVVCWDNNSHEGPSAWTIVEVENPGVAYVGDTNYETLAEAVNAAEAGQTITLLADATLENPTVANALTIDLNGHALAAGTVTVENALTISGEGTLTATGFVLADARATLTAPADLNVEDNVVGHHVVYANGVYSLQESVITSISEINNDSAYVFYTVRSPLYYSDTDNRVCSYWTTNNAADNKSTWEGDKLDVTSAEQQFALLRTNKTEPGRYYLYSIKSGKFIINENEASDTPEADITLNAVTFNDVNCFEMSFAGNKVNVTYWSNNAPGIRLNNANTDKGNAFRIYLAEGEPNLVEALVAIAEVEAKAVREVATKADLDAAIAEAEAGDVIKLTSNLEYNDSRINIDKAIILDLNGNTITTNGSYGVIKADGGCSIKNGKIVYTGTNAVIKVWNANLIKDIEIEATNTSGATIGGIVIQEGSAVRVNSIKNVTIKGDGLTNGIQTYNCGTAKEDVIGYMEEVNIDARGVAMNIYAPCGTAKDCTFKGDNYGIEIWIKGTYNASLDLVNCTVEGGETYDVFVHDEFNNKPGLKNDGTLTLTADEATGLSDGRVLKTVMHESNLVVENKAAAQPQTFRLFYRNYVEPSDYVAMVGETGFATLEDAFAAAQNGEDVELIAATYEGIVIPAEFTGKLVINGNVVVENANGSAITGENIYISGTGTLTAIANGDHAYGIGGDNTKSINIENVHILKVQGGHYGEIGSDTKYYKDAPEGGAAIGSGNNGAIINLTNVTIDEALGGSKAAGIGARYHTGVTININGCTIKKVEGGATAAGIGGSRVSRGATESEAVTINIQNSTIEEAKGGAFAAGIGSGYDTYCQANQPICTINIDGSTINAQGGQYAAGIGTGYHNAGLAGEIKNSTITAASGDKVYKDSYTSAQDIGFGVADLGREGSNNDSSITYDGTKIALPSTGVAQVGDTKYATLEDAFAAAIAAGKDIELIAPEYETIVVPAEFTGKLVINGNVVVENANGSAITGENIYISGTGTLTAIANGDHAYGIGGDNTKSINIENVHILKVQGGHYGEIGSDTKYYKDAPEGGAAIGSGNNGAIINLTNVTIDEALGGSKAAGIGARYHTGVTININGCTIKKVEGGATAAGIGGSRVSRGATESEAVTINIQNSTIEEAKGGAFAAGIGSGYDTYCQANQPICTINIDGSTINAQGGQYAAGIGTGYHNAGLAGEIKNSTITAASGDKVYKDSYTSAQDIGFGVADLGREGSNNDSSITYDGTKIALPRKVAKIGDVEYATLDEALAAADAGETIVLLSNVECAEKPVFTKGGVVNIDVNGHILVSNEQGRIRNVAASDGSVASNNIKFVSGFGWEVYNGGNVEGTNFRVFPTLNEAVAYIPANDRVARIYPYENIKLANDITLRKYSGGTSSTICVDPGYDITLDLNGYTVLQESPTGNPLEACIRGNFVLDDTSDAKTGKWIAGACGVTDTSNSWYGNGGPAFYVLGDGCVTLKGGEVSIARNASNNSQGAPVVNSGGLIRLDSGSLIVDGATLLCEDTYGVMAWGGNVTVNSGKFEMGTNGTYSVFAMKYYADASVEVNSAIDGYLLVHNSASAVVNVAGVKYVTIGTDYVAPSVGEGLVASDGLVFTPVATIGEQSYPSLQAAVAAAQAGETVVVLENVEVASGTTITLDGINLSTLDGVTLTNNGAIDVKGEVSLNIVALAGEELNLLDGAIVKNSTVGGSAFVAGAVTFRGANTFAMLYDFGTLTDYYGTTAPMKWIVEEGASVTLTDKARYGLGYGDNVTVNGNIENALAARETVTEADRSLFVHGLVAQESKGWNCNSAMTVKDAYVVIGSNNSFGNKPGNYGGTYTFNFENSVVDASRITFYEALSTTTFTFDGCDVKMGTFMTRDADSKFTLKNSRVLSTTTTNGNDEGNYNKGELTLVNSSLTYSAELKHEDGVINLDCNSVLTAPAISGAGKITVDATGLEGTVTVINGNMANFTGTIEIVRNEYAKYEITDEGLVVVLPKVAAIGETYYATLQAAVEAAQADETVVVLENIELSTPVVVAADKNLTLDLNGKTVSYTSAVAGEDMITNRGNLTITDSSDAKTGKLAYVNTDTTASNVTVSTISTEAGSTLVVDGGTIENKTVKADGSSIYSFAIDILTNGNLGDVNVTINGGTVYSDYMAIRQFNNGTACKNSLTINGGYIYGAKRAVQVHMDNNAAVTAISGGKVEAGAEGYALCNFAAAGNLEVTGGEFIGAVYSARENFISGGTFSEEPYSGYLADHYVAELGDNGYYGIKVEEGYIFDLEIIDGEYGDYTIDSEKIVGKLTYVRTLPAAGIWYPVFLPFDVPVDALAEKFDVARINDLHTNFSEEDGSIKKMWIEYIVRKSGTLAAGKPFLVRAKDSANLEMSIVLEEVKLYPASKKSTITVSSAITKVTFEGVYEVINSPVSTPSTRYMAVNADGVWDEFYGYSLNPFRVMMTLEILDEDYYINSTASLSVGSRVVGEENEDGTTTIYDVFVDRENDGTIYDLQGRKVLEITEPGIYIINGKKVLVK